MSRNLMLLFTVLLLSLSACHKNCDYRNWDNGLILGPDYRECACCGGWFIEIEGDTLRANVLPEEFVQTLPDTYPVPVRLRWEKDETPCLGDEIVVLEIEKR